MFFNPSHGFGLQDAVSDQPSALSFNPCVYRFVSRKFSIRRLPLGHKLKADG
jgi:hypothetical protein